MENRVKEFIDDLGAKSRLILLGGMAVVRHGLPRYTKDVDIWMEPFNDPLDWATRLMDSMAKFPGCRAAELFPFAEISGEQIQGAIRRDGVIRILGLEVPIDVFREPNQSNPFGFPEAWNRSLDFQSTMRLMSEIDLILTKNNTGRDQDMLDVQFLEGKLREQYGVEIRHCAIERATFIFSEFLDHHLLEAALKNHDPQVQELARENLLKLVEEGDPFAKEIWDKIKS